MRHTSLPAIAVVSLLLAAQAAAAQTGPGQYREYIYAGGQLITYQANFSDVPPGYPAFYGSINAIANASITSGCGGGNYCPEQPVTRDTMAVFLLRAKQGPTYNPPPCVPGQTVFADVPANSPFCPWIEELYRRHVVSGCGNGNYCPANVVSREQMAPFLLVTLDPNMNPPACGTPIFADVSPSSPFCRWIEELYRRGIAGGCNVNPLRYCPTDPVTRGSMAAFLVFTFSIPGFAE